MSRNIMLVMDLERRVTEQPESCIVILDYLVSVLEREDVSWVDPFYVEDVFFPEYALSLERFTEEEFRVFQASRVIFVAEGRFNKSGKCSAKGARYFREDFIPFVEYAAHRLGYRAVIDGEYLEELEKVG